jgi:hypothetical protein
MKKISLLVIALVSALLPLTQAQANTKSLVIIDSYFDSRSISGNTTCITLQQTACSDDIKLIPTQPSHEVNHGNAMALVARKQSASINILLVRSGTVVINKRDANKSYVNAITAQQLDQALQFVKNNYSKFSAVSISRGSANNGTCRTTNSKTDASIKDTIKYLSSVNVPVFISTGNKPGSPVEYPACIAESSSVAAGIGGMLYNSNHDSSVDYVGSTPANVFSYNVGSMLVPQTTSQYVAGNTLAKTVNLIP